MLPAVTVTGTTGRRGRTGPPLRMSIRHSHRPAALRFSAAPCAMPRDRTFGEIRRMVRGMRVHAAPRRRARSAHQGAAAHRGAHWSSGRRRPVVSVRPQWISWSPLTDCAPAVSESVVYRDRVSRGRDQRFGIAPLLGGRCTGSPPCRHHPAGCVAAPRQLFARRAAAPLRVWPGGAAR